MKRLLFLSFLCAALNASAQLPSYVPTDGLILWSNLNASSLEFNLDGATPTLGRFGVENSGLAFDGIDDKASISLPNLPAGNDSRSVSIWFYLQGENNLVGNGQKTIFHSGIVSYNQRFCVLHWNSGLRTVGEGNDACNGCGGTEFLQYIPTPIGTWHHMCVTHNGTTTKMYINGTLSYSANKSYNTNQNGGTFWLGFSQENHHSGEPFLGILDDVGLWSRALNPDEVDSLFNASAPILGCTDIQSCNFDSDANVNNGSCIPSGCMEEGACNYNADAECEGEPCDYSCCPGPGCCGNGMHWDTEAQTCVITPPSVAPDAECTLLNLQELVEGYQILLAQNAELDSLLADCNGTSTSDQTGPCAGENVVTYHGYDYDIVEIGNQCWFAENLKTQQYSDATSIPSGLSDQEWITTSVGAFANFDSEYGFLYNWFSVSDPRGLCPNNWHVSEQTDWDSLESISSPDFPIALKSSPTQNPSWDGNNQLAFNAVPAGRRRNSTGAFDSQLSSSYFWLKDNGDYYRLGSGSTDFTSGNNSCCERAGFSVRCVKD